MIGFRQNIHNDAWIEERRQVFDFCDVAFRDFMETIIRVNEVVMQIFLDDEYTPETE